MDPDRASERVRPRAPHRLSPEEQSAALRSGRMIVPLTRRTATIGKETRTLHFTFPGGQPKSARSRVSFVDPAHVPPFQGDRAWFEVERVRAKPHAYWRAVRQVEPPADARA